MFPKIGSYITAAHPAGYPLFLVLGKDRILRCFHNVCRHRAHPVVSGKQAGCSSVLVCKYHGWSYDLAGKLIKAPKFDEIGDFSKAGNALFEVNVSIDEEGFVFVHVGKKPSLSTRKLDQRFLAYQWCNWRLEGKFNWKLAGILSLYYLNTQQAHCGV